MFARLHRLKTDYNYTPTCILDIGAHHGNWTKSMMKLYPLASYFLFEGIDYPQLDLLAQLRQVTVYKNVLLNDTVTTVDWYEEKNKGDSFLRKKRTTSPRVFPFSVKR